MSGCRCMSGPRRAYGGGTGAAGETITIPGDGCRFPVSVHRPRGGPVRGACVGSRDWHGGPPPRGRGRPGARRAVRLIAAEVIEDGAAVLLTCEPVEP